MGLLLLLNPQQQYVSCTGNIPRSAYVLLLRIEQEEQSHYVYIKKIESLLNLHHQLVDKDKRHCPICAGTD
jgi:hypothetical protein